VAALKCEGRSNAKRLHSRGVLATAPSTMSASTIAPSAPVTHGIRLMSAATLPSSASRVFPTAMTIAGTGVILPLALRMNAPMVIPSQYRGPISSKAARAIPDGGHTEETMGSIADTMKTNPAGDEVDRCQQGDARHVAPPAARFYFRDQAELLPWDFSRGAIAHMIRTIFREQPQLGPALPFSNVQRLAVREINGVFAHRLNGFSMKPHPHQVSHVRILIAHHVMEPSVVPDDDIAVSRRLSGGVVYVIRLSANVSFQ